MDQLPSILGLLGVVVVLEERKDRYHREVVDVDRLTFKISEVGVVFNRSAVLLTIRHKEVVLYSEDSAVVDIVVLLLLSQLIRTTFEEMGGGRIGVLDNPEVLANSVVE